MKIADNKNFKLVWHEWRTSRQSGLLNLDRLNLNSKLCLVVGTWQTSLFITKQSLGFRNRSSRLRNLGDGKSSTHWNYWNTRRIKHKIRVAEPSHWLVHQVITGGLPVGLECLI